jgi:hypothetical protein
LDSEGNIDETMDTVEKGNPEEPTQVISQILNAYLSTF